MSDTTGDAVVRQAQDDSWWNEDPLVVKAAVTGTVGSVLLALGAFGLVTEEQRLVIIEQVGAIAYGLFVVLPFVVAMVTAIVGKVGKTGVFSPKTAAEVAVRNYNLGRSPFSEAAGGVAPGPTLDV
jgi:hypothetical protein